MTDERDLETRLEAALDVDATVACDRDERVHDGPVRFTAYCEDAASGRVREQLSAAETGVAFETRRSR